MSEAGRAALALALAAGGEAVFRTGRPALLGWGAFALAAGLLAWRGWPPPAGRPDAAPEARRAAVLLGGLLVAVALNGLLLTRLATGPDSPGSTRLWLLTPVLLLGAAAAAGGVTAIPERWAAWRPGRLRTAALPVVAILLVAAVARFPGLDTVPRGIYPDEGDMAALSMRLLNHTVDTGIFGFGWYYLGMPYFELMAGVMNLTGQTVGGARLLSAIAGFLTVPVVLLLAARNFGLRAGLAAGALLAVLGPALQFSRLVTNGGPTAFLWAVSAALLLEAARRGKAWAWVGAGISGGMALYFYPSGRLWGVQAALVVVGLLLLGPRGTRRRTVAGASLAAIAAFLVMSPFLLRNLENPSGKLTLRFQETSIFNPVNAARLGYWSPDWSLPRFLAVQLDRSLGLFDRLPDQNYLWPTEEPILGPALAALTLLGLGAAALRPRDPRLLVLSCWFWTGFIGVVVTVETPNFHRMAAAVPVLALFPALVLDETARRLEPFTGARLAGAAVAGSVALLCTREATYYFTHVDHDPWRYGVREGEIVASHPGAWVVAMGRYAHAVNSGWVRLLAPDACRAGLPSPGRDLPPRVPANRGLVFLVHPQQRYYLPLLAELLPGGRRVTERKDPPDLGIVRYEVSRDAWRTALRRIGPARGLSASIVVPRRFSARRIDRAIAFGSLNDEVRTLRPFRATWDGTLHAPSSGTYGTALVTACATELWLDGRLVLRAPAGGERSEGRIALEAGPHEVRLVCHVVDPGALDWTWTPPGGVESVVPPSVLTPRDGTIVDDPRVAGRPFTLVW